MLTDFCQIFKFLPSTVDTTQVSILNHFGIEFPDILHQWIIDECEVRYRKLVGHCGVLVASLCYALTWAGMVGCVMQPATEKS